LEDKEDTPESVDLLVQETLQDFYDDNNDDDDDDLFQKVLLM
jgi:hypothetical protein